MFPRNGELLNQSHTMFWMKVYLMNEDQSPPVGIIFTLKRK